MAQTAADTITEAMPLLIGTLTLVFSVAAVLWIAASALGRGITTRIIVRRLAADYGLTIAPDAPRWAGFAILQFARVLMLLILIIGYLSGSFIAVLVSNDRVLPAAFIVFTALAVSSVVWSYVNWILSLAPIFLMRDALSPINSVVAAIAFVHRNRSRLTAIALWNSTLRGLTATVISIAGACTVVSRLALPPVTVNILLALETIAYLVISDVFLLARLAAYASVAVRELALPQELSASSEPSGNVVR